MTYIFCKGIKKLSDYVTFPCDSTGDIPQSLNLSILSFSDFQFLRFYFGRSGEAVGLSAISLLAFSRSRLRYYFFTYPVARPLPTFSMKPLSNNSFNVRSIVVSLISGQSVAISDFFTIPSFFSNTAFTLSAFDNL